VDVDRAIVAALSGRPAEQRAQPRTVAAAEPAAPPEVTRAGDEFLYAWTCYGVAIGVTQLRETGEGLHAELTVQSSVADGLPLHWGRLNLASTSGREALVGKLAKCAAEVPWRRLLETVCVRTAEQFRAGEPIEVLTPALDTRPRYLVEPLLPAGETAVLFGDGGSFKSTLALALAVSVTTGLELPCGFRPAERTSVLYLDLEETSRDIHADRLHRILAGLGVTQAPGLYYRVQTRALADDIARLRPEITRRGIGLVIIDSYGPACGGEPETADSAIRLMNALRSLAPATRLVIAHMSRVHAEQRSGPARPFGSVFVQNLARSVWEVRRPDEDAEGDVVPLGLYHRKANQGRRGAPIGLRVVFQDGTIRLESQNLADEPELAARASLSFRLLQALREGSRTVDELAEATDAPENQVRARLSAMNKRGKVIQLDEARGRRGVWGLRHEE